MNRRVGEIRRIPPARLQGRGSLDPLRSGPLRAIFRQQLARKGYAADQAEEIMGVLRLSIAKYERSGGRHGGEDSAPVTIGMPMADGTIYAGISPTTGTRMFTQPADAPELMTWKKATQYAFNLEAAGHKGSRQQTNIDLKYPRMDDGGWRLPTKAELKQLYDNMDSGALKGTFRNHASGSGNALWYWSCTEPRDNSYYVYDVRFTDGVVDWVHKDGYSLSARLVRTEPRP